MSLPFLLQAKSISYCEVEHRSAWVLSHQQIGCRTKWYRNATDSREYQICSSLDVELWMYMWGGHTIHKLLAETAMQGADLLIGSNLGFSILASQCITKLWHAAGGDSNHRPSDYWMTYSTAWATATTNHFLTCIYCITTWVPLFSQWFRCINYLVPSHTFGKTINGLSMGR